MISDKKLAEMKVALIKRERALAAKHCGATWCIQAGGIGRQALIRLDSFNFGYPAPVFDELCIDDFFHLEHTGLRDWYLGVGDLQFNISVTKAGKVSVMLYGGGKTSFTDGR